MTRALARLSHGLVLMTLVVAGSMAWADDVDGDGYDSLVDCYDQYYSAFKKAGSPSCVEDDSPTVFHLQPTPQSYGLAADHTYFQDPGIGRWHLYTQSWSCLPGEPWSFSHCPPEYIRHYISDDNLNSMNPADPPYVNALSPTPGAWDARGVWAPFVIRGQGNSYFMYYAGISSEDTTRHPTTDPARIERIGMAQSSDLMTWDKQQEVTCPGVIGTGSLYEPWAPWTEWGAYPPNDSTHTYAYQCRDPFVIEAPGEARWYMFVTVKIRDTFLDAPASFPRQAVHVATSIDLLNWTAVGWIKATASWPDAPYAPGDTLRLQRRGGRAENPFVTSYNGRFYLFFTDYGDPAPCVQYAMSSTLSFDSGGSPNWVYQDAIPKDSLYPDDTTYNATEIIVPYGDTWLMSQSVVAKNAGDMRFAARDLVVRRIIWTPFPSLFALSNVTDLWCRVPSAAINPGRPEVCFDGLDNNCRLGVDEGCGCRGCQYESSPTGGGARIIEAMSVVGRGVDGSVAIHYELSDGAGEVPVVMEVFDVRGRHVSTVVESIEPSGPHEVVWGGKGKDGERLGAGIYLVRLRAGTAVVSRKIMVAR